MNDCPIVAFRSAKERHFRRAKGDNNWTNDPQGLEKNASLKPKPLKHLNHFQQLTSPCTSNAC